MATLYDKLMQESGIAKYGRNYGKENPFAGTEYESLWENNPYADLYYTPGFWDGLGLSNKAKDTNSEYDRQYNEYIAGIYEQQRQDHHNSESEKVDRMKQAGLNPDLQGLANASETDALTPPNAGMNPALNGQSPAMSAFGTITSVLGFATSTLQQINQIKGLALDNVSKENNNMFSFFDLARPAIIENFAKRVNNPFSSPSFEDVKSITSFPLSRKQSKYYQKAFDFLLRSSTSSLEADAYSQLDKNNYAIKHYIGNYVDLSLGLQRYAYNKAKREDFLQSWRNKVYKDLSDDFNNGSFLAGLMLIGQNSLPVYGARAITTTAKGLQSGWNSIINSFKY